MTIHDRIICVTSCKDPRLKRAQLAHLPSGWFVKDAFGFYLNDQRSTSTTQDAREFEAFEQPNDGLAQVLAYGLEAR